MGVRHQDTRFEPCRGYYILDFLTLVPVAVAAAVAAAVAVAVTIAVPVYKRPLLGLARCNSSSYMSSLSRICAHFDVLVRDFTRNFTRWLPVNFSGQGAREIVHAPRSRSYNRSMSCSNKRSLRYMTCHKSCLCPCPPRRVITHLGACYICR